jgi:acyl-CoA synthetase (AMP-forming)/AMP-acid ligase II
MELMPSCGFSQGFGMTETCGGVTAAPLLRHGDVDERPGTAGRFVATTEAQIVDAVAFAPLPAGEVGELWLRGPQITPGYWKRPEETARAITADGWLRTGDIGLIDSHGYLFIKDRLKDMIISGGENVYSVEVEEVLTSHPSVLEAVVYGIRDERWGEAVKGVVRIREGSSIQPSDLIAYARGQLAHFKCPKVVELVTDFPRSGSGKILKQKIRSADPASQRPTA